MIRKHLTLFVLCSCISSLVKAQQYGLFNTRTLFDGFENPAQKTFVLDSSRKYASNFFLPNVGIIAANKGNTDFIRRMINEGIYDVRELPLTSTRINTVYQSTNIYLFTLKIFQSDKFQKEMGFAWQVRSDAHLNYTNETLIILDNEDRFNERQNTDFNNAFTNNGYEQSYHQFSFNYRENYSKRLAFGVKLSLLSGITYNKLQVKDSYYNPGNQNTMPPKLGFNGSYRASFYDPDELSAKDAVPVFKNPGLSFSLGTSYTSKTGVFLMANLKDMGFIKWAKSSYYSRLNNTDSPTEVPVAGSSIEKEINKMIRENETNESFFAPTNAKVDVMISKTYSVSYPFTYTPGLIVSKNIFYKGGDAAFVNKFKYNSVSVSAIPSYNFNNLFLMGLQGMYQTPNFEVFLGSDNLFKTVTQINGLIKQDRTIGSGYNGASFYMGLGIKFGNTVNHPQNSSYMPGLVEETSFFKRLFGR